MKSEKGDSLALLPETTELAMFGIAEAAILCEIYRAEVRPCGSFFASYNDAYYYSSVLFFLMIWQSLISINLRQPLLESNPIIILYIIDNQCTVCVPNHLSYAFPKILQHRSRK